MWSKRDGGASFEKGEFMTDKSLALNLSRKEALNGPVGLRQCTPKYEEMDEVKSELILRVIKSSELT